ncbi:putative patellin-6-like [Sesbania bispinosa]|nr:putative patellin-6-like [Sesbania bispinosa]
MPKRELRVASNQILSLFHDNYPEMVSCEVIFCFESGPSDGPELGLETRSTGVRSREVGD